jgi:hypothetical protein
LFYYFSTPEAPIDFVKINLLSDFNEKVLEVLLIERSKTYPKSIKTTVPYQNCLEKKQKSYQLLDLDRLQNIFREVLDKQPIV